MRYSKEVIEANWINKMISLSKQYISKGIHIIEGKYDYTEFEYRDSYYDIMDLLNSNESVNHAICIVGIRRTGKSVMLSQIKNSAYKFGINNDEILHISLGVIKNSSNIERDELDLQRVNNINNLYYPKISDIEQLINYIQAYKKIKLVIIDEITLCEDFITYSKGFFDSLFAQGIKVLLAGTESASFIFANESHLYSRLILVDVSYIPFGEYCRLKKLDTSDIENKRKSMDLYIKHGNILDNTVDVDEKYIESAVGVNLALSIINSDNTEFQSYENNINELVQNIIKYFKLIGENINVSAVNSEISRADLSRAIKNVNNHRVKSIDIKKSDRKSIVVEAAQNYFNTYDLKFGKSLTELNQTQLEEIDDIFSKMGMIYSLAKIPKVTHNNAQEAEDIYLVHSLLYNLAKEMINNLKTSDIDLSDDEVIDLCNTVLSTIKGRIIENIIALQYIKQYEKNNKLLDQITYYDNSFNAIRKGTKYFLYKYNENIQVQDKVKKAEVDLVINNSDCIELIEIKKSSIFDEAQIQWITLPVVQESIRNLVSNRKCLKKTVLYMGENKVYKGVEYKNIPDLLLKEYELNFNRT